MQPHDAGDALRNFMLCICSCSANPDLVMLPSCSFTLHVEALCTGITPSASIPHCLGLPRPCCCWCRTRRVHCYHLQEGSRATNASSLGAVYQQKYTRGLWPREVPAFLVSKPSQGRAEHPGPQCKWPAFSNFALVRDVFSGLTLKCWARVLPVTSVSYFFPFSNLSFEKDAQMGA